MAAVSPAASSVSGRLFPHVFQGAFHSALYERARKGDAKKGGWLGERDGDTAGVVVGFDLL